MIAARHDLQEGQNSDEARESVFTRRRHMDDRIYAPDAGVGAVNKPAVKPLLGW